MPLYWMVKKNIHHGASGILVCVWKHWVHFIFNFQQSVYMTLALELDTQNANHETFVSLNMDNIYSNLSRKTNNELNINDNSIKIITFNKENVFSQMYLKFQAYVTHSLCIKFKHS